MSRALHFDDNTNCSCRRTTTQRRQPLGSIGYVWQWTHELRAWIELNRQRRALRTLDDRLLDDIGVSPDEASRESAKRFWQVYASRHMH